jgi:hypothetical protein
MEFSQADDIVAVAMSEKIAGIIATNATAFLRETLISRSQEPGGLSGKPLRLGNHFRAPSLSGGRRLAADHRRRWNIYG